jgi:hypothetical protein
MTAVGNFTGHSLERAGDPSAFIKKLMELRL